MLKGFANKIFHTMVMESEMNERVRLLEYWIREREAIRIRKEDDQAPPPWTKDPILQAYRFCNVRREDDKVTRWLAKNWREPHGDSSNFTAAMVLARLINNPETLAKVGFPDPWDWYTIREGIRHRRNSGRTWLNPAYLVTTCGVQMDKMDYIVDIACVVHNSKVEPRPLESLESFHTRLMQFKGLGNFLAAQVVADLKNTMVNPLAMAPDYWTWAAVGPGSLKGLRAVTAQSDLPQGQFLAVAQKVKAQVEEIRGEKLEICMQDFQNCLCEFSKYWRAHAGLGRPKQRYHASR